MRLAHHAGQLINEAIHHLIAVQPCKPLRPSKFPQVSIEGLGPLTQVRVILFCKLDTRFCDFSRRDLNVLLRDLVPHPSRTRVQETPDIIVTIQAQLDEVVATTQAA